VEWAISWLTMVTDTLVDVAGSHDISPQKNKHV
jgi:hypothetical protein